MVIQQLLNFREILIRVQGIKKMEIHFLLHSFLFFSFFFHIHFVLQLFLHFLLSFYPQKGSVCMSVSICCKIWPIPNLLYAKSNVKSNALWLSDRTCACQMLWGIIAQMFLFRETVWCWAFLVYITNKTSFIRAIVSF